MDYHGLDGFLVENCIGNDLGNVSVDALAASVATLVFLLLLKLAGGKKSVYFKGLEQSHLKGSLQF
jgi:hypothetical protein